MKKCSKCGESKELSEFYAFSSTKDGRRPDCKTCGNAYNAKRQAEGSTWAQKYPELQRIRANKYSALHREDKITYDRIYRALNKDKISVTIKLWALKNPEKRATTDRNRKALKRNALGSHTELEIKTLFGLQRKRCAMCECDLSDKSYHVDHIMPLIRGGSNDKYNLQITCPTCNLSKGPKDPIEFMQSRGKLL